MRMLALIVVVAGCGFEPAPVQATSDGSTDGSGSATGPAMVDATASTKASSTASVSWMHTVSGSNRLLVVGVSWGMTTTSISSVTYAGVAMTPIGSKINTTKNIQVAMFTLVAPPTGAHTATVTFGQQINQVIAGSVSFTSVDQVKPTGAFASVAGPDNPNPSLMIASAPTDIVMDTIVVDTNPSSITVGSGQTQCWNLSQAEWAGGSTMQGASSVTTTWHQNGSLDDWALGAVSVHGS